MPFCESVAGFNDLAIESFITPLKPRLLPKWPTVYSRARVNDLFVLHHYTFYALFLEADVNCLWKKILLNIDKS